MERNYSQELDELQEQMKNLQNSVSQQFEDLRARVQELMPDSSSAKTPSTKKPERVHITQQMHPDSRLSEQMEELCYKTEESGRSGLVTYLGVYNSGGRQSNWIRSTVAAEDLLSLIENGVANKVLACIGNENRLAILLSILREPKTVASLVNELGFGSTGQVYHHMKPLLAADIITEDEQQKGVYVVQPHKVQGIIMLLAGISDMVDETYTKGTWDAAVESQEPNTQVTWSDAGENQR